MHTYIKQNTQNKTNRPTLNNNKPKQKQTTTNPNYNKHKTSLNPYVQKTNHTKHLKRTRPTGLVPNQIKINNKNIKTKHNNKTHQQPTKHPNHITYLDHKTLKITNNQRRIIYKNYTKPNITYTFPSHFIFLLSENIETLLIHKIQKSIRENTTKLNNTPKTTHHNTTLTPINNLSKHQDKQTQHVTHKCHLKRARPTGLAHKQKNKTKRHHPHKNTHAKTTKKKITKKQPSLINTLEQNIITNMNNKRKNKYHKQKKNLTTHKNHKIHLLLLRCGDIETNPGPMPNILSKHPPSHKQRNKTYFIPCTIKLQPEYQHLVKEFSPLLNTTHPRHLDSTITYPHLSRYIHLHQHHPPPRILYALITTISPSMATCNHQLTQTPNPDWTTSLLNQMTTLPNPPERHILTPHPYTQFKNTNSNLINPPNTIHNELYNYVRQNEHINLQTLTNKFPFLPLRLLIEALNHNTPLT